MKFQIGWFTYDNFIIYPESTKKEVMTKLEKEEWEVWSGEGLYYIIIPKHKYINVEKLAKAYGVPNAEFLDWQLLPEPVGSSMIAKYLDPEYLPGWNTFQEYYDGHK